MTSFEHDYTGSTVEPFIDNVDDEIDDSGEDLDVGDLVFAGGMSGGREQASFVEDDSDEDDEEMRAILAKYVNKAR